MWRHTRGSSGRPASDLGWGSSSKTAPGSLSTGSRAGRTPPHADGSMYSHVRAGKWLRPPPRAFPSVIVDTEKVLREADGPMKRAVPRPAMRDGLKGVRPRVRLKNRTVRADEEPRRTQARMFRWLCKDYLKGTCMNSFSEKWHPPECFSTRRRDVADLGKSARMHIVRLMNILAKGPKRMMTKVQ